MIQPLTTREVRKIVALRARGLSARIVGDMVGRCHRTVLNAQRPPRARVRRRTSLENQREYQQRYARVRRRERIMARGGYAAQRLRQIEGEAS